MPRFTHRQSTHRRFTHRRFAHQVYATVVGVLLIFAALLSLAWAFLPRAEEDERLLDSAAQLAGKLLPPPDAGTTQTQAALDSLVAHLPVQLALWSTDGHLVAQTVGRPALPSPVFERRSQMLHGRSSGYVVSLTLPDGRWLVARHATAPGHRLKMSLAAIGLLALAIGLGAYPLTRRVTRRLERLRRGVDELSRGDLSARVEVEGRDEVAALATSFNHASRQIEQLVETQQSILVGASHELRSPLARIRLAIDLLAGGGRADLVSQVAADIAELDGLIDEILLASRLETSRHLEAREDEVDLLALAAEEAARVEAQVEGEHLGTLRGNERLLRRMLRNLLENAARHGRPPIRLELASTETRIQVRVSDGGAGVPEAERGRIFEPFYRPAGVAESGHGYGIGLALVRRIARLHGGEATCVGDSDRSYFEVDLPKRT